VTALLETVRTDSEAVASLLERIAGEAAWQALNDPAKVVEVPAQLDRAANFRRSGAQPPDKPGKSVPIGWSAGTAGKRPWWADCGAMAGRNCGWCGRIRPTA
jgi:hypothetical protein